jgi:hypothetical protein
MARLEMLEVRMVAAPGQQTSFTDPDARAMKTRVNGIVGNNVRTAVVAERHLLVAHEVTNQGNDRTWFSPMVTQAHEVMDTKDLTVVADAGCSRAKGFCRATRPALPLMCRNRGSQAVMPTASSMNMISAFWSREITDTCRHLVPKYKCCLVPICSSIGITSLQ